MHCARPRAARRRPQARPHAPRRRTRTAGPQAAHRSSAQSVSARLLTHARMHCPRYRLPVHLSPPLSSCSARPHRARVPPVPARYRTAPGGRLTAGCRPARVPAYNRRVPVMRKTVMLQPALPTAVRLPRSPGKNRSGRAGSMRNSLLIDRRSWYHGALRHVGATTVAAAQDDRNFAATRPSSPQGGLHQFTSARQAASVCAMASTASTCGPAIRLLNRASWALFAVANRSTVCLPHSSSSCLYRTTGRGSASSRLAHRGRGSACPPRRLPQTGSTAPAA